MTQLYYSQQDILRHQKRLKKYIQNENDIKLLSHIMYEFDPTAFEYFVAFYYSSVEWYHTQVIWGYDDEGIDVVGKKWNNKILIQCKKYITNHVKKEHVGYFYGLTVNERVDNKVELIYITTSWYTPNAKKFCNEKSIHIKSYIHIIAMAHAIDWQKFQIYCQWYNISIVIPNSFNINKSFLSVKIVKDSSFEEEMKKRKINETMKSKSYFESIAYRNIKWSNSKQDSYFDKLMNK
jgi:hypothetical protein